MTRLYLIRHAEAEGNLYRRVHGSYDGLITENGKAQLLRLAERFASVELDAVYSSDRVRTTLTARAVAEPKGLEVVKLPGLREIDLGIWEDMTWGDVIAEYASDYRIFSEESWNFTAKNGESSISVADRITETVYKIVHKNENKSIAVVSHGFALRTLTCRLMGLADNEIGRLPHYDNTSVTTVIFDGDRIDLPEISDNSHLTGGLSTLEKQGWWRSNDLPTGETNGFVKYRDANLRFVPADLRRDGKTIDIFHREARMGIYGNLFGYTKQSMLVRVRDMAAEHPDAVVFAEKNDVHAGLLELDPMTNISGDAGHISFIYLTPENRGKGFGAQLLGHAVSFYRKLGRRAIELRVAPGNEQGLAFYNKHGFYKISEQGSVNGTIYVMRKNIV